MTSVLVTVTPPPGERDVMTNHTYRVIEIVGSSPDGIDAAIRNGVARAAETTRGLDWFEVQSVRGHLENGAIGHFQVALKVGFRLEEA
jgi:dodecin